MSGLSPDPRSSAPRAGRRPVDDDVNEVADAPPLPATGYEDLLVIRVVGKMLIPYILVFGFYIIAHGEVGPGGGFQGGVVLAAAYILYGLIYGRDAGFKVLPRRMVDAAMAIGVLIFSGIGAVGLFRGHAFLDYRWIAHELSHAEPLGMTRVESGVGLTVAAVMITIFNSITEPADQPRSTTSSNETEAPS